MTEPSEGFYDDSGNWWPDDAEWCDRCQGSGIAECYCGGDQCYCKNNGGMECPTCQGEGYFIPTDAFKKARDENAKFMREVWAKFPPRDSDTHPKDGDGEAAPLGSGAGPKAIAQE